MIDISKLSKDELKHLLKDVTLLSSLKKSLWKRGKQEFQKLKNGKQCYKIEYYESSDESLSFVKEKSIEIFQKMFWAEVKLDDIEFMQNQNLQWWMRIFYNDDMFDLSYRKFENLLK